MSITNPASGLIASHPEIMPAAGPPDVSEPAGLATHGQTDLPASGLEESLSRVAALAAMSLGAPRAFVMIAGARSLPTVSCPSGFRGQPSVLEQSRCADVAGSGDNLIIDSARAGRHPSGAGPGLASTMAWAGVAVHDKDGHVLGVLWAADRAPRLWSGDDVTLLEVLAGIVSSEVALRTVLAHDARRAALARTLEESLLPPRLPDIPGLEVATRYTAGSKDTEALGDLCDVFPSLGGTWGMVVGDACGKGPIAAKNAALARISLRTMARRLTRPALILAGLNEVLLDWPTDDSRFLTAIYSSVRPCPGGVMVRISSAGHPLALVRSANGYVREFGKPGTLLGVLSDPELHDSQKMLRAGDSLIMFSDGVTEARSGTASRLYGDERLRRLVAGLGDQTAQTMAEAIQLDALTFTGGRLSDDVAVLVMKVPHTRLTEPG
jgi:phosphoserine phosphatase RsbU/P